MVRRLPDRVVPLFLAIFPLLLAACESAPAPKEEAGGALFFPLPPETPRVQFLTWASGAEELEAKASSFDRFILGEDPKARPRLNKPFGLAARDGVLYVCDTQEGVLARLDFKARTYTALGADGAGRLRKPINLVIDQPGFKFVADAMRNEVVVFGPDDAFVTAHAVPPPCRVVDVGVHGNELFVLDNDSTPQVVVLDRSSGQVLRTFGGRGNEAGRFNVPAGLSVSDDGFVYVSDSVSCRIQKLTRDGAPVWSKGEQGYHIGQFGRPRGIRAGPGGVIYVADAATELVQLWNAEGSSLMYIGGPGNVPGAMVLPANVAVDATSLPWFKDFLHPDFRAEYLVFVANQFGQRLVNVYAFGSFPEGYKLSESAVRTIPVIPATEGMLPGAEPHPAPEPKPEEGGEKKRDGGS